jgi:hypothetical protein
VLHTARFARTRLTLTGISGEFTTIPFKLRRVGQSGDFFEASEVLLTLFQTIPAVDIIATTPQGVATLDIVFEVRTRRDA